MPLGGWLAGSAIVGGGLLSFFGGQSQAAAQQRAAEEQLRFARQALAQREKERQEALGYAGPSASELESQQTLLQMQRRIVSDAQKQLDYLQSGLDIANPGASQLGKGMFVDALERTLGKEYQRLRMQLGERGITSASTAGQGALARFSEAAANAAVGAQQQLIGQSYGAIGETTRLENILRSRMVNAALASPISDQMMNAAQYAGASQVGAIGRGGSLSQLGGNIANLGAMTLGNIFGSQSGTGLSANQFNTNIDTLTSSASSALGSFTAPKFGQR